MMEPNLSDFHMCMVETGTIRSSTIPMPPTNGVRSQVTNQPTD